MITYFLTFYHIIFCICRFYHRAIKWRSGYQSYRLISASILYCPLVYTSVLFPFAFFPYLCLYYYTVTVLIFYIGSSLLILCTRLRTQIWFLQNHLYYQLFSVPYSIVIFGFRLCFHWSIPLFPQMQVQVIILFWTASIVISMWSVCLWFYYSIWF